MALRRATLRGQAVPTGKMWTLFVNGWDAGTDARLLAEAGTRSHRLPDRHP